MRGLERPAEEVVECTRCLLDNTDTKEISFDSDGVCNYCRYYEKSKSSLGDLSSLNLVLESKIEEIKRAGKNKKYDCILGLSGGVDSSFMALKAKEFGLRPLVVHLDNGWNTDIAVRNIEKICEKLNFELHTHVIDWEEFSLFQKAYIKAGVVDIEVLSDHAITAILYRLSHQYNIKYSLSGFNIETEAVMPKGWTYNKRDFGNIKDIVSKYGDDLKFNTYPYLSFWTSLYYHWVLNLESVQILNYLPFDPAEAKEILKQELAWVDCGGKHHESLFTKFYQNYILPAKFGIDKRKAHLSNQICAGKITKENALNELEKPLYDNNNLEEDKRYFLKKIGLSESEFAQILLEKPQSHESFKTDQLLWKRYFRFVKRIKFWRKSQF
jgi:N-acetyl sugar amidotransferase